MTTDKARARIAEILIEDLDVEETVAGFVADKIYADVVATAVDDERNVWIILAARRESDFIS